MRVHSKTIVCTGIITILYKKRHVFSCRSYDTYIRFQAEYIAPIINLVDKENLMLLALGIKVREEGD